MSSPEPAPAESITLVSRERSNASPSLTPEQEKEIASKFRLRVVDADDSHALGGAQFVVAYWRRNSTSVELTADGDGICQVPLAVAPFETLRVWVSAERHVPKVMDWHDYELTSPVDEYVSSSTAPGQ